MTNMMTKKTWINFYVTHLQIGKYCTVYRYIFDTWKTRILFPSLKEVLSKLKVRNIVPNRIYKVIKIDVDLVLENCSELKINIS